MSLDVWLTKPGRSHCSHCGRGEETVFEANITHNVGKMASEAGIYKALWRPDEIPMTKAGELVPLLEVGLKTLIDDPERFEQFNPENGWGDYEGLVRWVGSYLNACKEHPDAIIGVSR